MTNSVSNLEYRFRVKMQMQIEIQMHALSMQLILNRHLIIGKKNLNSLNAMNFIVFCMR
jgi:hypothetical protein